MVSFWRYLKTRGWRLKVIVMVCNMCSVLLQNTSCVGKAGQWSILAFHSAKFRL